MDCKTCGHKISEGAPFCSNCGWPVRRVTKGWEIGCMVVLLALLAVSGTCVYAGYAGGHPDYGYGQTGLVSGAIFSIPLLWIGLTLWFKSPGTNHQKLLAYRATVGLGLGLLGGLIACGQFLAGQWTSFAAALPGVSLGLASLGLFVSCIRLINRERL